MSELLLGINIDHVATLRNARGGNYPNPAHIAIIAESAGANGITMHLREDRRHIREKDLILIKQIVHSKINLEISPTKNMLDITSNTLPHSCCLVPENRQEITTESGLDIIKQKKSLRDLVLKLKKIGIEVSVFIDPIEEQVLAASKIHANCIEINTGNYSNQNDLTNKKIELKKIKNCSEYAIDLGLKVHAGHGLHIFNVYDIAKIKEITEINIGHSIISRSIILGIFKAIQEIKHVIYMARDK
ncbi:MAG: pyridoxine 5'-phosphate synthase [Wigglesworthia glossinidia]|nr:pyridoxine 5'-phosphate synthase [Wigglesworthia glossinidia]